MPVRPSQRTNRNAARRWLADDPAHLSQALAWTFTLTDVPATHGLTGHTRQLLAHLPRKTAQGVAALLVGERHVRPAPGAEAAARGDQPPPPFTPVTLTRKGLDVLQSQGVCINRK